MKFAPSIFDSNHALNTEEVREAFRCLRSDSEKHYVQGVWQVRSLCARIVELTDLDTPVRFTEAWGSVRLHGQILALLGWSIGAGANLP